MRSLIRRCLRLELIAGLGMALVMPALAVAAESMQAMATQTTLSAETHDRSGRTEATVFVTVTGEDGLPAIGAVAISDNGKELAGAALNSEGKATFQLALPGGEHQLRAAYSGDLAHQASTSDLSTVRAQANTGTPDFQISIAPAALTLTAGQSGTVIASVTPENASQLTGPMFVTLSCAGNPDESTCTFTPESVEILQNAVNPVTSSMVFQTQSGDTLAAAPKNSHRADPIAWALMLPGALGLVAFGRRRRWLVRVSLLWLVGVVTLLGTTGCNPLYSYNKHRPILGPATPSGSYTIKITAQSANGVTATEHTTTLALTVN